MLKGIYKEFITVKITDNPLYEEAIFILKCSNSKQKTKKDMIFEANRILCEKGVKKPRKRKKIFLMTLFSIILLSIGIFVGMLSMFLLQKML